VDPEEVAPIHETATWNGRGSYDPTGGEIVDYAWSLVSVPTGSSSELGPSPTGESDFVADLAGTYVAELVVQNDRGQYSAPCQAELQAIPLQSFWVEMFWERSQDDMDLHVLAPGGTLGSSKDCHWQNCVDGGLDWGVSGFTGDNPSLDLDDIPWTGPENINIDLPADGVYTVIVHDYQGSTTDYYGDNEVTVKVYVEGSLLWTDSIAISGDDSYTTFVAVEFPDGTVQ
jgi:hypothetical protein